jgi:hypothetical protein
LHVLSGYGTWKPQDPRHLFGPAARLLGRVEWARDGGPWGEWETAWWGFDGSLVPERAAAASPALCHFPQAGVTVMRRDRDYLLVTNGIVGTGGFGNHKHNDLLSFEYHAAGLPVIVDPGSYVYTSDPSARNLFRSTRSHNTLSVDGVEQNDFKTEWLFRMFEQSNPEHLHVDGRADVLEYRGRHRGYERLPEPIIHERRFHFSRDNGALTIVDVLQGRGTHRLEWHFHFAPGVTIAIAEPDVVHVAASGARLQLTAPAGLTSTIATGWYSPSYGVRVPCMVLDLEATELLAGIRHYTFQLSSR